MFATKGRKLILIAFFCVWGFIYCAGFIVESAFVPIDDRGIPWPWQLRGTDLRDLVIIPSIALAVLCGFFFWQDKRSSRKS